MTTEFYFSLINKKRTSPIPGPAYVVENDTYSAIWNLAVTFWGLKMQRQTDSFVPKVPEGEPHLSHAFTLLKEVGWTPFFGEFTPPTCKDSRFRVRRLRYYEKRDFDEPEYLTIHRWGNWYRIFAYDGVKDGLYKGKVAKAKWSSRYGITDSARSPSFVNDELKNDLEAAKLVGLEFLPVLWDQPATAKGKFWQISSSIVMPPCLLPILEVPEDRKPWTTYDDGGHFPQELVFRRSEVKTIEPFDVALTSPDEEIHCGPNSWPRTIVVSQRFRHVIKKLKLTTAELIPARLVSDDWQRPLSDHDQLRIDGL